MTGIVNLILNIDSIGEDCTIEDLIDINIYVDAINVLIDRYP